jgi:hypothetical protein
MEIVSEEWRPVAGKIKGFPYEVSNLGRVRSIRTGRILKGTPDTHGYLKLTLQEKPRVCSPRIHRLVAEAFVEGIQIDREVNHINGIKTDNRSQNLNWVSRKENIHHAMDIGLRKGNVLSDEEKKLAVAAVKRRRIPTRFVARWFNISPTTLRQICS